VRGFFKILWAELVRSFIIMRRYWFASIISIGMGYATLVTLVYGLVFAAGSDSIRAMADNAINGILGFLIGAFAFGIVGMFTQGIQGMARTGELEQVCLSPFGLVTNFLARSFVMAVNSVISCTVMILLVTATVAKESLHWSPFATVVLLVLTYINLIGFGYMVGGLVLVFKYVGQIAVIIRFSMIGLAIFATEQVSQWPALGRWFAHAMPVTDAAICLKYVLIQGQMRPVLDEAGQKVVQEVVPVLDAQGAAVLDAAGSPMVEAVYALQPMSVFLHESFLFLVVSCVVWTVIGIACFRYLENWSRDKGTLGTY